MQNKGPKPLGIGQKAITLHTLRVQEDSYHSPAIFIGFPTSGSRTHAFRSSQGCFYKLAVLCVCPYNDQIPSIWGLSLGS